MASTIQQTKFIMDNDRIEDDISDDEIYEAIQNSLKELKVTFFFHFSDDVKEVFSKSSGNLIVVPNFS